MTSREIHELARLILSDIDGREKQRSPDAFHGLSTREAYAVQRAVAKLREERGERIIGYKIGCTSPTIQAQLGIDRPIFAPFFDSGEHPSGTHVPCARYANLAVEGELAVRLADDVPTGFASEESSSQLIQSVFPVIELHDYWLRSHPPCASELIAVNGMHAGFVAGEPQSSQVASLLEGLLIRINGGIEGHTHHPWSMGSAMAAIQWLAVALKEFDLQLTRDQVILTGSVMRLFPVQPGAKVSVEVLPAGPVVVASCE